MISADPLFAIQLIVKPSLVNPVKFPSFDVVGAAPLVAFERHAIRLVRSACALVVLASPPGWLI